jgi:hypothetical protein
MLVHEVRGIKRSAVLSLLMVLWLGWANGGLGAVPDQGPWMTGAPASTKRTEVNEIAEARESASGRNSEIYEIGPWTEERSGRGN